MTIAAAAEVVPRLASEADPTVEPDVFALLAEQQERREAIYAALYAAYGPAKHRALSEQRSAGGARISGFAVAGTIDRTDQHLASVVNPNSGSMILSTGAAVDAELTARGFEGAMLAKRTAERHISTGLSHVNQALHRTVPKLVRQVRAELGHNAIETSTLAAQIVGDKLIYNGQQPLYVYTEADCKRLQYGQTGLSGLHVLSPERNFVIMLTGHNNNDALPATPDMQAAVRDALTLPQPSSAAPEGVLLPTMLANHVAQNLNGWLRSRGVQSAVLVSIVDVARPTADTRPAWQQTVDRHLRAPSVVATHALSRFAVFRGRTRSGLASHSRGARLAGNALLTASELALGASTVGLGYVARAAAPYMHILVEHGTADVFGTTASFEPLHNGLSGNPDTTIADVSAVDPAHFVDSYLAVRRDQANHGQPSTITNMVQQSLAFYGHQAGRSDAEITRLQHNPQIVDGGIQAFIHDNADPDNARVTNYPDDWVLNGTTYSLHNMNTYVQHVLGLDLSQPTRPPVSTPPPSGSQPDANLNLAQAEPSSNHTGEAAILTGIGLGALVLVLLGAMGLRRNRRHDQTQTDAPAAIQDDIWQTPDTAAADVPDIETVAAATPIPVMATPARLQLRPVRPRAVSDEPAGTPEAAAPTPARRPTKRTTPNAATASPAKSARKRTNTRATTGEDPEDSPGSPSRDRNQPAPVAATTVTTNQPSRYQPIGPGRNRSVQEIYPELRPQPRWKDWMSAVGLMLHNPTKRPTDSGGGDMID